MHSYSHMNNMHCDWYHIQYSKIVFSMCSSDIFHLRYQAFRLSFRVCLLFDTTAQCRICIVCPIHRNILPQYYSEIICSILIELVFIYVAFCILLDMPYIICIVRATAIKLISLTSIIIILWNSAITWSKFNRIHSLLEESHFIFKFS